jgi:hypothetical protein
VDSISPEGSADCSVLQMKWESENKFFDCFLDDEKIIFDRKGGSVPSIAQPDLDVELKLSSVEVFFVCIFVFFPLYKSNKINQHTIL